MATFHDTEAGRVVCVKGAPAAVLAASVEQETGTGRRPLSEETRQTLLEANRMLARDGLRVLALAWRSDGELNGDRIEGLAFLGLVGLPDPVRPGSGRRSHAVARPVSAPSCSPATSA